MTAARLLFTICCALLAMLLAAGCGGADSIRVMEFESDAAHDAAELEGEPEIAPAPGDSIPADIQQAEAELQVVIEEVGATDSAGIPVPKAMRCTKSIPARCTTEVTCPAEASDGDPADVCRWLTAVGEQILRDTPDPNQACTMQYGGPERLLVSGTLNGKPLGGTKPDSSGDGVVVTRSNGCEISRFDALAPLVQGSLEDPAGDAERMNGDPDGLVEDPDTPVSSPEAPHEPDVIDDPPSAFDR